MADQDAVVAKGHVGDLRPLGPESPHLQVVVQGDDGFLKVLGVQLDVVIEDLRRAGLAGLACGEPGLLAWKILYSYADVFVTYSDSVAIKGMRILANPLAGDGKVVSGESGAVTTGLLACLVGDARYRKIAEALKITQESKILLVSTEGDTDPDMYQKIVSGNAD